MRDSAWGDFLNRAETAALPIKALNEIKFFANYKTIESVSSYVETASHMANSKQSCNTMKCRMKRKLKVMICFEGIAVICCIQLKYAALAR